MGMFDYVKCEVPLPDNYKSKNFQTKDFDNELSSYTIKADGRLICHGYYDPSENEWIDYEYRGLDDFSGEFEFYDLANDGTWREYRAFFLDGHLMWIRSICGKFRIYRKNKDAMRHLIAYELKHA